MRASVRCDLAAMKRFLVALALCLSGCSMVTNLPAVGGIAGPGDSRILGLWDVSELMGSPISNPTQVEAVEVGPNLVELRVTVDGEISVVSGVYASIGSLQVMSLQNNNGNWNILFMEISDDNRLVIVRAMSVEAVRAAVEMGHLSGEVVLPDTSEMLVSVDASSPDLVAFINGTPEIVGVVVGELARP